MHPALKAGLAERGLELGDVRHLLLSHIHFDHAGAAGTLVREHPALQVHVSEIGAPHVVDPRKLEASARRLYGDAFDALWGELAPVPEENVHVVGDDVLGLECFPTPGHASHHVSYLHADGTLYAGDAAGVRIVPAPARAAPAPPPDIDLEAWERTLEEIERRRPERLALTHFGVVEDVAGPPRRAARDAAPLGRAGRPRDGRGDVRRGGAADASRPTRTRSTTYERAAPVLAVFRGLERYWRKRREAAAASP